MHSITEIRDKLQNIDEQVLDLLSIRKALVYELGQIKKEQNLAPLVDQIAKAKETELIKYGKSKGLKTKFIRKIWRLIHHDSVKYQIEIMQPVYLLQQLEKKKLKIESKIQKRNQKNK